MAAPAHYRSVVGKCASWRQSPLRKAEPWENPQLAASFEINGWLVEPNQNTIARAAQTQKLDHKVMALLSYFSNNPGRDLGKDEILEAVWGSSMVSEEVLTVAVSSLRKAFGDDPAAPIYIKTIPRHGYHFLQNSDLHSPSGSRFRLLRFLDERIGLRFVIIASIVLLFLVFVIIFALRVKHFH